MFNKFVNFSGNLPDELIVARVIPLFKGEGEQLVQSYCLISALPFFSKIFVKIVATRVIEFLEDILFFYKRQFGFRKKSFHKSC